nr:MAG TPA: hypothetical protein [Caudoviricetes sp.]
MLSRKRNRLCDAADTLFCIARATLLSDISNC